MARIFISHSWHDKPFVYALKKWLDSQGHYTWIDEHEIHVGEPVQQKIEDQIGRCDTILFVLSPDAVDSPWVQEELSIARREKKILIPLLLKDCNKKFPIALQGIKYADFREGKQQGWQELAQGLSRRVTSSDGLVGISLPQDSSSHDNKTSSPPVSPKTGRTPSSLVRIVVGLGLVVGSMGLTLASKGSSARLPETPATRRKSVLLQIMEHIRGSPSQGPDELPSALPIGSPVNSSTPRALGGTASSITELRRHDKVRPLQDNESNLTLERMPAGCFGFVELGSLQLLRKSRASISKSATSFEVHKTSAGELLLVGYTSEPASAELTKRQSINLTLTPQKSIWANRLISIPLDRINGVLVRFDDGQEVADLNLTATLSGQ